jgi:hypothetical protein
MITIIGSVGKGGKNLLLDVKKIQEALNGCANVTPKLIVDGRVGSHTFHAILQLQMSLFYFHEFCDGRIDPHGRTLRALNNPRSALPPQVPIVAVHARARTHVRWVGMNKIARRLIF